MLPWGPFNTGPRYPSLYVAPFIIFTEYHPQSLHPTTSPGEFLLPFKWHWHLFQKILTRKKIIYDHPQTLCHVITPSNWNGNTCGATTAQANMSLWGTALQLFVTFGLWEQGRKNTYLLKPVPSVFFNKVYQMDWTIHHRSPAMFS